MSNLVDHARRELKRLGNDKDFDDSVIKIIESFSSYGHSGFSAAYTIPLVNELLQYNNLTPLTDDPREWNEVGPNLWQSSRRPDAFSKDGGKSYYLLSEQVPDHPTAHKLSDLERLFRFKTRATSVEAVQIGKGNEEKALQFFERTKILFELVGELEMLVETRDGPVVARKGEWVVKTWNGVVICTDEVFRTIFEPDDSTIEEVQPI